MGGLKRDSDDGWLRFDASEHIRKPGPYAVEVAYTGGDDGLSMHSVTIETRTISATPPVAAPAAGSDGSYVGRWRIQYTNSSIRTYLIGARGDVLFVEENRRGQLNRSPDGLVLDLADGKPERLKITGTTLAIERFESKAALTDQPPVLSGTGTLIADVVVPPAPPPPAVVSAAARLAAAAETRFNQSLSVAGQNYSRELATALQGAMRAGDLDDANAINAAVDKIKKGQQPARAKFKSTAATSAQSRYEQAATAAEQQYARELDAAQKEALRTGNLDEANAINTTRKKLE